MEIREMYFFQSKENAALVASDNKPNIFRHILLLYVCFILFMGFFLNKNYSNELFIYKYLVSLSGIFTLYLLITIKLIIFVDTSSKIDTEMCNNIEENKIEKKDEIPLIIFKTYPGAVMAILANFIRLNLIHIPNEAKFGRFLVNDCQHINGKFHENISKELSRHKNFSINSKEALYNFLINENSDYKNGKGRKKKENHKIN